MAWLTAFASKPAPTDFCVRPRSAVLAGFCLRETLPVFHRSPVGARLPAKTILPQCIRGLADRVRQQAGSYRFLRTPKVGGVSRIAGLCLRQTLPVLHRSPVGARLPAKAILLQRIRGLVHRVRQQVGSYRFLLTPKARGFARIVGYCARRTLPVTPGSTDFAYAEGGRHPGLTDFAYAKRCRCCTDHL